MYRNTAMATINKAIIMMLDFFEPVDRFKNEPAADEQRQKKK